jgi:outer membrane protein assembly factor BamC
VWSDLILPLHHKTAALLCGNGQPEIHQVNKPFAITPVGAAILLLALGMSGCSSFENMMGGDKIDYRSAARKTNGLEVPPDLTPLAHDGRYLPQAGTVSANSLQQQGARAPGVADSSLVAPVKVGDLHIERQGTTRFLLAPQSPDVLFPKIRQFWIDRGFAIAIDSPEAGMMETEWAENRAKLPNDIIRSTLGRVLDTLYSTGERDKFRTHLERTDRGTEITITHRGLEEVFTGDKERDGSTMWTNRPSDPQLEGEFLTRLMVNLGAPEAQAKAEVAAATSVSATPKARATTDQGGAALQLDDSLERSWRRVGLALDRSGFTVEDRDRAQLVYFVRYIDPKTAGKEEPGFFSKLFSSKDSAAKPARYRVAVKANGNATLVSVQNDQGQPDNSANAQRIIALLVDELKF